MRFHPIPSKFPLYFYQYIYRRPFIKGSSIRFVILKNRGRTGSGRVNFETGVVYLGGLKEYIPEIRRCRRLLLIGEYFNLNFSFGMGRGVGEGGVGVFYNLALPTKM